MILSLGEFWDQISDFIGIKSCSEEIKHICNLKNYLIYSLQGLDLTCGSIRRVRVTMMSKGEPSSIPVRL